MGDLLWVLHDYICHLKLRFLPVVDNFQHVYGSVVHTILKHLPYKAGLPWAVVPGGGTCKIWNGEIWCGANLAPILKYYGKFWYKIPRLWHNKHRPCMGGCCQSSPLEVCSWWGLPLELNPFASPNKNQEPYGQQYKLYWEGGGRGTGKIWHTLWYFKGRSQRCA